MEYKCCSFQRWKLYQVSPKLNKTDTMISRSGLEEVDEREIFKGSENRLIMTQTYTHEFQCVYSLARYPFDKQTCSIDMTTSELDSSTLRLFPKKLWMEQDRDMTLFYMDSWQLAFRNESSPEEDIRMTMHPKMIDFWLIFCQLVPFTEVREKFNHSSFKH